MSVGLTTYQDSSRREDIKGSRKSFKKFIKGIYKRFGRKVKKHG